MLDTTSKPEYIRLWTDRQIIDIWQSENGNFFGQLTTWTDEFVGGDEEPTNRTFITTKTLSSDTVQLFRELLKLSNILALPTDDSIKGWRQGFDGITYIMEYSTKDNYSFKSYWTPKAQDSLKEAVQVQAFVDTAFHLSNAEFKKYFIADFWKAIK